MYEQELKAVEKCLNDFNYQLGALTRAAQAFTDPDAIKVFGTFPIDLTNLAVVARTFATKCAVMRHRMYKTAEWNDAYKEAYGMNHPNWEGDHGTEDR